MKMQIMTNEEWDHMVALTGGNNSKMHWRNVFSLVNDTKNKFGLDAAFRAYRGYLSARYWDSVTASNRYVTLGFRPAIDILPTDPLYSEVKEGQSAIMGTLYMNGKPVRVPQNPTYNGDIVDYVPGATLEMGAPIPDSAYQVVGIRVGNALIADRNVLKMVSCEDIEMAVWGLPLKSKSIINKLVPVAHELYKLWDNETTQFEAALSYTRMKAEQVAGGDEIILLLLAHHISQICMRQDEARFSTADYTDALINTSFLIDYQKLVDLAEKDKEKFNQLVIKLAEQKRAVYEGRDYSDRDKIDSMVQELELTGKDEK